MKRSKTEAQETMERLLQVAREEFADKGYADTALEMVADIAQVTRGALYHHFKNKKGCFSPSWISYSAKFQNVSPRRRAVQANPGSSFCWAAGLLSPRR